MATADYRTLETPVFVPQQATSLAGFQAWANSPEYPERGQISFIQGGVLIDMSPERPETHNKVKTEITVALGHLIRTLDSGWLFSDRVLLVNEQAGLATEPDAMFAAFATIESGQFRGDQASWESSTKVLGTPDWVLEIVSPSSKKKVTELLVDAYHRAGIPEYWLIDALGEAIDFKVLVREPDAYRRVEPVDRWHASPTFGRAFRLDRERDRLDLWRYTLEIRED